MHIQGYPQPAGSQYTVDDAEVIDNILPLYRKQAPRQSYRGRKDESLTNHVDESTLVDLDDLDRSVMLTSRGL